MNEMTVGFFGTIIVVAVATVVVLMARWFLKSN